MSTRMTEKTIVVRKPKPEPDDKNRELTSEVAAELFAKLLREKLFNPDGSLRE